VTVCNPGHFRKSLQILSKGLKATLSDELDPGY
jgi:hypothetical protein